MPHAQPSSIHEANHAGAAAAANAAADNWIWQQYATAAGNQFAANGAISQATGMPTQDGVIIYQLAPNGSTQNEFVQSTMAGMTVIQSKHDLSIKEETLEPGEVPLAANGQVQHAAANGTIDANLYQVNPAYANYGTNQWGQFNGVAMKRPGDDTQPDAEKQLLRSALQEKCRELLRLTRELEQAYGLIHHLKQQNEFYQRQWGQQTTTQSEAGNGTG